VHFFFRLPPYRTSNIPTMRASVAGVLMLVLGFTVALVVATTTEPEVRYDGHQVLRFFNVFAAPQKLSALEDVIRKFNLDRWSQNPLEDWLDVRIPPNFTQAITKLVDSQVLPPYYVMINDLQQLIEDEKRDIQANADNDFFNAYRTLDQFNAFLDELANSYPQLVTKRTIGSSLEGRPINGIAITSANGANKVRIVYNGGQHAREWISPMTVAWIAFQLTSLYGQDDEITRLVDQIEWTIIPVLNPDGYVYTWSTDRMWRKNRRVNTGSACRGVDNNRNWDFHWGEGGSSANPCAEDFRGPRGFSEPEETAIANFIRGLSNVKGYIDFHAYSQLWMTPWGYTTALPSDYNTQIACSRAAADALRAVYGTTYRVGPIATTIYPASGSSADWAYGVAGVTYSFAIEGRDTGRFGFLLPVNQIVPSGTETMAAVRVMGNYILNN